MKVLVINLERSPARLEFMRQQFSSMGVEMERLNGVDGQTLSDADLEWHKSVRSGYHQRTRPQIGCTLSHRLAWKNVAEGGHDWVFICEDDVFIDPLAGALLASDGWLPGNIDILKAETTRQKIRTSLFSKNVGQGRRIARLLSNHAGSGGYYLHRNAAQKLLKLTSENFSEPTDETLFNPFMGVASHFRIFQMYPALCIQDFVLNRGHETPHLASLLEPARALHEQHTLAQTKPTGIPRLKKNLQQVLSASRVVDVPFGGNGLEPDIQQTTFKKTDLS
tara:strand:+ start:100705 stop:101541 length:837 start_codon:yes stop_codon:yes gene_type:complete